MSGLRVLPVDEVAEVVQQFAVVLHREVVPAERRVLREDELHPHSNSSHDKLHSHSNYSYDSPVKTVSCVVIHLDAHL